MCHPEPPATSPPTTTATPTTTTAPLSISDKVGVSLGVVGGVVLIATLLVVIFFICRRFRRCESRKTETSVVTQHLELSSSDCPDSKASHNGGCKIHRADDKPRQHLHMAGENVYADIVRPGGGTELNQRKLADSRTTVESAGVIYAAIDTQTQQR